MSWILPLSIAMRVAALIWSAVLWRRLRDWRMGLLTAMLGLMALRQLLTLERQLTGFTTAPGAMLDELPGLVVSLLAMLFVALLDRLVVTRRLATRDRDAAEARLVAAEERYRRLVESAPDTIFSIGADGNLLALNPAFESTTGHRREDWIGRSFAPLVDADDLPRAQELLARVLAGEAVSSSELRIRRRSGRIAIGEFSATPEVRDGEVIGATGVARDVTDRRRAETAMRRVADTVSAAIGETFFRRLVQRLSEVLELNYAVVAEMVESEREKARTLAICADGEIRENVEYDLEGSPCERVMERGLCSFVEGARSSFPGDRLLAEMEVESYIGAPLRDSAGRPLGLLAVMGRAPLRHRRLAESVLEIFAQRASAELERLRAEQALRRSERRYRSLFEESQDAIFITTPGGQIVDINPAGVKLFGYESKQELLRVDISRDLYWDPWDRERSLRQLAAEGSLRDHELVLKKKDGSRLLVVESSTAVRDDEGNVLAHQGILRDVSDRRHLEEELRRSQRMEAVGRLAGGIAHDFNNLLTVINGQSDLILAELDANHRLRREVGEIKAAGRRAAALTRQLLILGRRRTGRPETLDLNEMLRERQPLLRQVVGRDVEVELNLAADLAPVRIDRALLEQLLLNLAVNARDAMAGTGELAIETRSLAVGEAAAATPVGLEPGRYVLLRIEDSGEGVDPAAREHLFEPFFVSEAGAESGLGLATVYGIVEQSGGTIRVDSEPGRGTAFEIYLPVRPAAAEAGPRQPAGRVDAGSETILLAEDELTLRNLLQQYLAGQGYRVLEAADGDQALALANRASDEIDLLLADVVMPGLRGSDLARQVTEHCPGIKVLLMSGYLDVPLVGSAEFIQKPFSTELLGRKLRELLDRSG